MDDRGSGLCSIPHRGEGQGVEWTQRARGKLSTVIIKLVLSGYKSLFRGAANTEQTGGNRILTKSSGDPKEGRQGEWEKQTKHPGGNTKNKMVDINPSMVTIS